MSEHVRDLPEPERGPLEWEDVRVLEEAGLLESADIARGMLTARDRRWRNRFRRWLARVSAAAPGEDGET